MPREHIPTIHEAASVVAPPDGQLEKLINLISRSQQGFRDLIDHLDQAVFTIGIDGEIRVANICFSEIMGTPFRDLIGHNISEFIEEPGAAETSRWLADLLKSGVWAGRISIRLRGTPTFRHFDCWLQAVEEPGAVAAVSGWARDVTTQREAEIRSTELFESLQEGVISSSAAGEILDVNPAFVRMLGHQTKEDLLGRNVSEIYENSAQREALTAEVCAKGFANNKDVVLLRKGGRSIICLLSIFAVRDVSGEIVRLQGTAIDVTEQREIARQLHQEREFGRRLIACFPDVIAVLDAEGQFTYVSDSVRGVLGKTAPFFIRTRIESLCVPEDRESLDQMLQSLSSGRSIRGQVECRMRHASGSLRSVRVTAAPLLNESGKITGVVISARDVTESNLLDQEVAKTEKFTAMGQMLAGAAHELNNPLTAILGISDLLRESASDNVVRRQAELLLKQARRAAGIVQNLLAFSRPVSDVHLPIQVEELVRQVLQSSEAGLREKGITVKFEAAPDLPAVEGDRKLLWQVLTNILVNAEQSISAVRESGAIFVSVTSAGERVCITVENDGPAIASEHMSKLFDPFFTTKRPGGGTGLGLTISLAIIKDHHGTIAVESPPAGGASFSIYLPALPAKASAPQESKAPERDAAAPSARPGKSLEGSSVLVVDDEESIREILEESLSARGMAVKSLASGQEALQWLGANSCDVVLCDFNMPGMKGAQLFEQVLARDGAKAPRFVLMTGEFMDSSEISHLRENGVFTLQKPFHVSGVIDMLASALR